MNTSLGVDTRTHTVFWLITVVIEVDIFSRCRLRKFGEVKGLFDVVVLGVVELCKLALFTAVKHSG